MFIRRRELLIGGAAGLIATGARAQTPDTRPPPTTPFDFTDDKIRIPVRIAGVDVSAMLDSGGQYHVIDGRLARDFKIKASGKVSLTSISGSAQGRYSDPVTIVVAGRTIEHTQFLVMDLSPFSRGGQPVEMILGGPLFRRFAVDIDFEARRLAIIEPADLPVPDAGLMAPVVASGPYMTTEVQLGGGAVKATIDTGTTRPLIVSPSAAQRLGILRGAPVSTATFSGLAGPITAQITSVPSLFVGGHDFLDVPVLVAPAEFGAEANLGLGVLSRFHLGIDFPERWLLVSSPRDGPFWRDLTGLYGAIEGQALRITHVARGGPAEKAGFKKGERIAAIDGEAAPAANVRLTNAPAGKTVTFTLKGGRTRSLTLARYY